MSYFMKRDYQRSKVYRWEHKNTDDRYRDLTLKEAAVLIEDIAQDFKIPTPALKDGRGRRYPAAFCRTSDQYPGGRIALPRSERRTSVVFHEMAHIIHGHWCRRTGRTKLDKRRGRYYATDVAHGPRFVDIMLYLRHAYYGEPFDKWYQSLSRAGVDVKCGFGREVYECLTERRAA